MLHVRAARFKQPISYPRARSPDPHARMTENCHHNTEEQQATYSLSQSQARQQTMPRSLKIIKIQTKSPNKQSTMCTQSALSVSLNSQIKREGWSYPGVHSVFVFDRSSDITGLGYIYHNSPLFSVMLTLFVWFNSFTRHLLLLWQLSVQCQPYFSNVRAGFHIVALSSPLAGTLETPWHPFFGKRHISSEERGEKNLAHVCEE